MNPERDNSDQQRFEALFASAVSSSVAPDREFLEELGERSAEVFAAEPSRQSELPTGRRQMFRTAIRGLAATAAAIIIGFGIWSALSPHDTSVSLGTVLENVANAETVHLQITRNGRSSELWAKKPNRLRWDAPDGTYKIARGPRLWEIDEKANRASSRTSPYFDADRPGLDVLDLLELPNGRSRADLLRAKPGRRIERQGRPCDVYRVVLPGRDGPVEIEALVDAGTQALQTLKAKAKRGGRAEPIAEVTVLEVNGPVDEDKFVVADTLTEDGRIGKVTNVQGIVAVKPVMHRRWTPLAGKMPLEPGDWVRTESRGANAVSIRLVGQTSVTLGPGSLVELIKPDRICIIHGELKIVADAKRPVQLLAPNGQQLTVKGTRLFRLDDEKLVRLEKEPLWLRGFEGATADESIGSLVANVDGRDVPLTVGYHKVSVDVRDQIARTVIEESFVNHTSGRLEGVFYFPLPQDASISGFGMWIGGELVEADVVEKQRAREIYEEILRKNRDPGLLEWSGGNLFKARVFPIFPHSEKRIKITYTQVLPLRGNRYLYSYGLQSELLKQHPLRELAIDVKINSARPLAKVTSPTHSTRIDNTEHSAHVEFSAGEYTPSRDFEVSIEVQRGQSDVVVIPHRRGDDGYFMLQLMPPSEEGQWQRDVLPDGQPLELLILADTSASLDRSQRASQAEFVATLLSTLTPEDKFNLAGCDVGCNWAFKRPQQASTENVAAARRLLEDRVSLGWTDLDRAFASALAQCGPKTRVIYIGDGIVTTGDGDPAALSKRLWRLCEGRGAGFHAVAVGNTFEPLVLKTIAALGGGTVRRISGEKTPQAVALELLGEIARPAIRDLKVEFRGVDTARVYPQELPNLPSGTQQILLGRYLPKQRERRGEAIVSGTRDGRPVRFRTAFSLPDADAGNSFIPRLWARVHLDFLLEQGASSVIRDEIIALSEEYHIITPYTSLLVLESDEDRERFKVKRRFQMRDGQKFFAAGRDTADYELIQQQMRRAGNWRLRLRRAVLRQLATLGRHGQTSRPPRPHEWRLGLELSRSGVERYSRRSGYLGGLGGGGMGGFDAFDGGGPINIYTLSWDLPRGQPSGFRDINGRLMFGVGINSDAGLVGSIVVDEASLVFENMPQWEGAMPDEVFTGGSFFEGGDLGDIDRPFQVFGRRIPGDEPGRNSLDVDFERSVSVGMRAPGLFSADLESYLANELSIGFPDVEVLNQPGLGLVDAVCELYGLRHNPQQYTQWLGTLFPQLPPPPKKAAAGKKPPWPAEARAVAESLLRTEQLARLEGGLRIERHSQWFDVRHNQLTSQSRSLALVSRSEWLIRAQGDRSQTTVQWCDARRRGIFSEAFELGRKRASGREDLRNPPLGLSGGVMTSIARTYRDYKVNLRPQGNDRTLLVLPHPHNPDLETRVLVDAARDVILQIERRRKGKVIATTKFTDFVERAGAWWATQVETLDEEGRRTSLVTQKFTPLSAEALREQIARRLAPLDRVQLIDEPPPGVVDAKQAVAGAKASFDDRLALAVHFSRTQQWDRVLEHLDAAEKLAEGKPGVRWVRSAVLYDCRRREELRKRILAEASRAAKPQTADGLFLAEYLRGRAAGILGANEMLALLDALEPAVRRQPPYLQAMKQWGQHRVHSLQQTGQADKALALQSQRAADYPHDCGLQQQYADALVNTGDYRAAYAWLDRTLADKTAKWHTSEIDSLHNAYAQFLRNQGRYPELVDYLAAWIEDNAETTQAYQQYLSALIRTDRMDEANRLMARWLKEGQTPQELSRAAAARLGAAVSQMFGHGYNMHTDRLDQRWLRPLAETVLLFARHKTQSSTADRIMGNHNFTRSDKCREVRSEIARVLVAEVDTLGHDRISRFVDWIWPNDPAVQQRAWRRIAAGLQKRWTAESDAEVKHKLAAPLARILSGRLDTEEHLAFLRRQVQEGPKKYRTSYVGQLFNALLGQPWKAEFEDETFGLLERLSDADDAAQRLRVQVQSLYRLTDRMVEARFDALMAKIEHQEKLTRTELREKKTENLKAARRGFADRLTRAAGERSQQLARWMTVERLYLDVRAGRNLDRVAQECWEIVGGEPKQLPDEITPAEWLEEVRRARCLIVLANLAARRDAKPELAERMLSYYDRGIAADATDVRWKLLKYQMLIALDRPQDLVKNLRAWIRVKDPDNGWRLSLGYLLAELGQVKEAIKLLEAVEAADELGPADYRTLANWYMAVDRREDHEQALIKVFTMMEEWRMSNWLSHRLRPWHRSDGQLPGELDKNVLRMFAALLRKSGSPQNYLYQLKRFYQATHDFRLLACLADGVVGHTAGQVYPFLQGMGQVLAEVRDEATADSIVEQLREQVRPRAKTVVDHRALDLLELLVERRAAEVRNQPGAHVDRALAAVQRAFKRKWSEGEPRLMADFLAALERISQQELAAEQLRELNVLHGQAAEGSIDRLHIAHALARTHWSHQRSDEAIDLLQSALNEHQAACEGVLPAGANGPLGTLIGYLESRGHHARGEKVLQEQLTHPANRQQTFWLTERLYRLYNSALANKGHVSLGTGRTLYKNVEGRLHEALSTDDHNHRYRLIDVLCTIYRTAGDKSLAALPGVGDDLRAFASGRLPEVLKHQTNNYQQIVDRVADVLHDVAGARAGLEFLVERIETEPRWFRFNNQDGWSRFGWEIARWRHETKRLGDLEPRLLAIVLAELRRDLQSRNSRNRGIYHDNQSYFWREKADDFARTAEEVYARSKQSGESVKYIAEYLYQGLDRHDRAIEMLFVALGEEILDESGQSQLVGFLHERRRYGESIGVLQPLVEQRPDNLQYRVLLMHAYFRTNRKAELLALLKQTDEHFHKQGRWTEGAMAGLAASCLQNELFEQSVAYYKELIPLHQRTQPGRGIGTGTLSGYYANLARAHAGLKQTAEAVDAACGAIVSWGRTHQNRRNAIDALRRVLRDAPELDAYVARLDEQSAESGRDKPIVRKALGIVYSEKKEYAKAEAQLKLACRLQPNDTETHQALIACYDARNDAEGAIAQLLASLQLSRRDIKLYEDLARRFGKLQRPEQAERAHTSIVEVLSSESESHALLAEIRQKQDRWDEAATHWEQVARIRALEPTGLLKLAAARIHRKQWDAAQATLAKLNKGWPSRFGDVDEKVRELRRKLDAGRKP